MRHRRQQHGLYEWLGRQVDRRAYHLACQYDGQRWSCEGGQDGDSVGGSVGGVDVLGSEHSEAGRGLHEDASEAYRLECTSSGTENRGVTE